MSEPAKCRHCGRPKVNRPRGLCWGCWGRRDVRESYPITSKFARRGVGNSNAASKPAASPCPHPQGSPGRIDTLSARAAAGESLWHPGDCREVTADATGRAGHAA